MNEIRIPETTSAEQTLVRALARYIEKRGYNVVLTACETIVRVEDRMRNIVYGPSLSTMFLYGEMSVFRWVDYFLEYGESAWNVKRFAEAFREFAALSGCSSAEEIEFRMKTTGIIEE